MKDSKQVFKSTLKSLLNERLSEAEEQSLKDEGYILKKPTRKAAVVIALYKKAAAGDLSAFREILGIIGDTERDKTSGKAVTIIDDTAN